MGVCLTIMVGYTRKGNNKGIIFVPEITYETFYWACPECNENEFKIYRRK